MYNLTARRSEPLLDAATSQGVGFIPWFPLAAGPLAAPDGPLQRIAADHRRDAVAAGAGLAAETLAGDVADPGHVKVAHLEENVAAAEITLSDDEFETLARRVPTDV